MQDDGSDGPGGDPAKAKRNRDLGRLSAVSVPKLGPGLHLDGGGLYLVVKGPNRKSWMLRTVVQGKRRDIGLGSLALVSLKQARGKALEMRRIARDGGDPLTARGATGSPLTFAEAAEFYHRNSVVPNLRGETPGRHAAQWISSLRAHVFPVFGTRPVAWITQAEILEALAPIWTAKQETARRVLQRIGAVLDWSRVAGHRTEANPVEGVERGLPRQRERVKHHAALPFKDLPAFMAALALQEGMGALALRFAILTAARSGEVRGATWGEVSGDVWTVPGARMKAERDHRVPLSGAALEVVEFTLGVHPGPRIFPGLRGGPLSDMTLSAVLKRMQVPVTVHGFRSTFRDWAEEATDFPHEAKEAALAHAVKSRTEAAYRRTDLFERRREMMQAWADFCTGAKP